MPARTRVFGACVGLFVAVAAVPGLATTSYAGLTVINTRLGTRCGSSTSFEVDAINDGNENLRGYVYLEKQDRSWSRSSTGLLRPGQRSNHYVCNGTGNYDADWDEGTSPSYPRPRH